MKTKKITKANFKEDITSGENYVLADFWAPWCGYCRRLSPALDQVAADYEGRLLVGTINIDEEPQLAEEFAIETIPTLILFKNGIAEASIIAPESRAQVIEFLNQNGIQ